MGKIVLISCVKSKRARRNKASELFTSALFTKSLAYAKKLEPDAIYILSTEYGVLALDDEIEPYDNTLNGMGVADKRAWANKVLPQLKQKTDINKDEFTFLAGNNYRVYLMPHIKHCHVPMEGLRRGEQLAWLTARLNE